MNAITPTEAPEMPAALQKLAAIVEAKNVATRLQPGRLDKIGEDAVNEYKIDEKSMGDWLRCVKRGRELSSPTKTEKSTPWKGAANVKYPLITSAVLQFNARAYPAVVQSEQIVKCKTEGEDPDGLKQFRADRVSRYLSYQLRTKNKGWRRETDALLAQLANDGTKVRKIWFDDTQRAIRTRLLDSTAFIVNKSVNDLEQAPRATDRLSLYPHEVVERIRSRGWLPIASELEEGEEDDESGEADNDTSKPRQFIEQFRRIDLDGDKYAEPYLVTVHIKSRKVVRIVAAFTVDDVSLTDDGEISGIRSDASSADYHFLPSLDGGFFKTGFGALLGDINAAVNTIFNMQLDAGHMASRGGGFIGSDFRIKGGSHSFRPGEYKKVEAKGATVRESIVDLTFPGPDQTLKEILAMLIDMARELSSVQDVLTGDSGGQKMTATTTLALIEQGLTVFTAAYKRIFESLENEFAIMARLLAKHLSVEEYSAFFDAQAPQPVLNDLGEPVIGNEGEPVMKIQPVMFDPAKDFDLSDMDIVPVADPNSVTNMQRVAKAEIVRELAMDGSIDPRVAAERVLEAASVPDREELIAPPPSEEDMAEAQRAKELEFASIEADIQAKQAKAAKDMADASPDAEAEGARLQLHAEEKSARLEQDAQLAREKMNIDREVQMTRIAADSEQKSQDRVAKSNDALVSAGMPPDYSFNDDRAQFAALMERMQSSDEMMAQIVAAMAQGQAEQTAAMEALASALAAPIDVERDAGGEITGARRVLQ